MSFPKQAALATLVVAAGVGGLYFAGRSDSSPASRGPSDATSSPEDGRSDEHEPPQDEGPTFDGPLSVAQAARNLVPPGAWLVVDFRGDITGKTPFSDQPGLCASVPAPERVAMAVLPPKVDNEPDLLIAAQNVKDAFWGCARDMIVRAGGTALAQNERYEVLKSPSGVVARGPEGSLVFLTSEAHLEAALAVLSELAPGAARSGPHAQLYARMHPKPDAEKDAVMSLTLSLPKDWLASVGQDQEKTPLRFISSAFLSSHADGSAQGGIDCEESGCAEVLEFLNRARADFLDQLPPATGQAIQEALRLKHVRGAGRIAVTWDPSQVSLGTLLGQFLGSGPLGP